MIELKSYIRLGDQLLSQPEGEVVGKEGSAKITAWITEVCMSWEKDNCREEEGLRRRRIEAELKRADEEAKWFELWEMFMQMNELIGINLRGKKETRMRGLRQSKRRDEKK